MLGASPAAQVRERCVFCVLIMAMRKRSHRSDMISPSPLLPIQGLPTLGELLKLLSGVGTSISRNFSTHHLHITPSPVISNLDSDLPSVHVLSPRTAATMRTAAHDRAFADPWTTLFGPDRAAQLCRAEAAWRAQPAVAAASPPQDCVIVSPVTYVGMLQPDLSTHTKNTSS